MSEISGNDVDDDLDENWVPLRDRKEWDDVTPIPQNDGPHSVVSINYSEKYNDVYGYLRAIIKSKEKSERALKLTEYALILNESNYTVWQLRRDIIAYLKKDIKQELEYTEKVMRLAPKNYQVWHHRHVLVELSQDPSQENRVTKYFLNLDQKNYHAWQHRQWYMRKFKLYDDELSFVEDLLDQDLRNNSAWNHRYFLFNNTTEWTDDVLKKEVDYTLSKIKIVRRNESSWNYLKGIMFHAIETSTTHEQVRLFCDDLYSQEERSPFLLAYIVDMCADALDKNVNIVGLSADRAAQLCEMLGSQEDKIRCQYWKYMKERISAKAH